MLTRTGLAAGRVSTPSAFFELFRQLFLLALISTTKALLLNHLRHLSNREEALEFIESIHRPAHSQPIYLLTRFIRTARPIIVGIELNGRPRTLKGRIEKMPLRSPMSSTWRILRQFNVQILKGNQCRWKPKYTSPQSASPEMLEREGDMDGEGSWEVSPCCATQAH